MDINKRFGSVGLIEIIYSFFLGLFVACSLAVHFVRFWNRSLPVQAVIIVIGSIAGMLFIYMVLFRILIPKIRIRYARKEKLILVLLTILLAGMFLFVVPGTLMKPPQWIRTPLPPSTHILKISYTGQKNPASLGNEVRLLETRDIDGAKLPEFQYESTGVWQIDGNELTATGNVGEKASELNYQFYGEWGKELQLLFNAGSNSGIVEASLDGKRQVIDLYDLEGGTTSISLETDGKKYWKVIFSICDYFSLAILVFLLVNINLLIDSLSEKVKGNGFRYPDKELWFVRNLEWVILTLAGLAGWYFLFQYSGGPSAGGVGGNDNLWYLYYAMFPNPDASGLNRYVYIYFLRFFVLIAGGDGALAARLSWSFCIAGTATLVYLSSRLLTIHGDTVSGIIKGILAIILFLSMPTILTLQTSLADHPMMLMVMLCVLLYILYIRWEKRNPYILVLFGVMLFFAFKIKESSMPAAILLFGLGFERSEQDNFDFKLFFHRIKYVAAGALAGLILVMLMDQLALGDAFFGLRLSNWKTLVDTNVSVVEPRSYTNWFRFLTYDNRIFIVFILSLINLRWLERNHLIKSQMRFIWLLPFALIIFLSLTIIVAEWGVLYRYMMWSLPVFSFLSVQFIHFDLSDLKSKIKLFWIILASFAVVYITSYFYFFPFVEKYYHWDARMFHDAVLMPMAFTVLIGLVLIYRNWESSGILKFSLFCCLFYILFPSNYILSTWQDEGNRLINREWSNTSELVYTPYSVFSQHIDYSNEDSIFISKDIFEELQMLSDNALFNHWSFSTYFRINTLTEDFYCDDFSYEDLEKNEYDYVFLWTGDWENISDLQQNNIKKNYKIYQVEQPLVLLERR